MGKIESKIITNILTNSSNQAIIKHRFKNFEHRFMIKLEEKIIALLSDYPEAEFYGQEISRKIKCSKASASIILRDLATKNIVHKKVRGNMKFFQINLANPSLKKFKMNLALDRINPVLKKFKNISKKIILFGSASRGEQTADSDIDLLILTNEKDKVFTILNGISHRLNIKAIVKTPGEWSESEVTDPEFYREVINGITLYEYVPRIQ